MKRLFLFMLLWPGAVLAQRPIKSIPLTLRPKSTDIPTLRYSLLPDLRDRKPGNAALLYYRAFSPEYRGLYLPETEKAFGEWSKDSRKTPPDALKFVKDMSQLKEVDRAARRAYCDWEREPRIREEGIGLLLPDIQAMRVFGRAIGARARFELHEKNFSKAQYSIQTGLSMARDICKGPTLIEYLVGLAVATSILEDVEAWIDQPDSPNLYWSLTALPTPFASLRRAIGGERIMIDNLLPDVREQLYKSQLKPMSPTQLSRVISLLAKGESALYVGNQPKVSWGHRLGQSILLSAKYDHALKELKKAKYGNDDLDKLPMMQIVICYEVLTYDHYLDEVRKVLSIPYPQARISLQKSVKEQRKNLKSPSRGSVLAALLLPAVESVLGAQVRIERRIAALRCIEALRLHAAANQGNYPDKLSDIKIVPIPIDPVTGNSFLYGKQGDKATLTGPAPEGESAHSRNTLKYTLSLK